MIDDELYLSMRIRVPAGTDPQQQGDLASNVFAATIKALSEDWPAVYIAGCEATYATFRPLPDTEGQVMHFTRHKDNGAE